LFIDIVLFCLYYVYIKTRKWKLFCQSIMKVWIVILSTPLLGIINVLSLMGFNSLLIDIIWSSTFFCFFILILLIIDFIHCKCRAYLLWQHDEENSSQIAFYHLYMGCVTLHALHVDNCLAVTKHWLGLWHGSQHLNILPFAKY
jgi:hypothetical protein